VDSTEKPRCHLFQPAAVSSPAGQAVPGTVWLPDNPSGRTRIQLPLRCHVGRAGAGGRGSHDSWDPRGLAASVPHNRAAPLRFRKPVQARVCARPGGQPARAGAGTRFCNRRTTRANPLGGSVCSHEGYRPKKGADRVSRRNRTRRGQQDSAPRMRVRVVRCQGQGPPARWQMPASTRSNPARTPGTKPPPPSAPPPGSALGTAS